MTNLSETVALPKKLSERTPINTATTIRYRSQRVALLFAVFFGTLPFQFALNPAPGVDLHLSRVFALALSLAWMASSLSQGTLRIPRSKETILIASFLFLSACSLLFVEDPSWGLRKLAFLLSFFPLFFVASHLFTYSHEASRFLFSLIVGSGLSAAVGIMQFCLPFFIGLDPSLKLWHETFLPFFSGAAASETVAKYSSMVANVGGANMFRASAFFPDPHIASFFWGMTAPIAIALAFVSRGLRQKVAILSGGILLLADILTFSRGGALALLIGTTLITLRFFLPIIRRSAPLFLLIASIFLAIIVIPNPFSDRLVSIFDEQDRSISGRRAIFREATALILDHPIAGVGLGNYSSAVKPSADYREPRYAHSLFLDIAAETGIPNAIILFLLLLFPTLHLFRYPTDPIRIGVLFSLLIFLTHALFETPIFSVHVLPLLLAFLALSSSDILRNPATEKIKTVIQRP